jgi:hypothetical protein
MMLAPLLLSVVLAAPAAPPLVCGGPYVPPTDFDERGRPLLLEFAVASVPLAVGQAHVEAQARAALVKSLCRLQDEATCAPLHGKAKIWGVARTPDTLCAMAVLPAVDLERWRTSLAPDLDAELRAAFAFVLPPAPPTKPGDPDPSRARPLALLRGKADKPTAIVVLGSVEDQGAPGGLRAEWLLGRVRSALGDLGVEMRDPPRGWDGSRPPRGVQYAVRGALVERVDPKRQLPVIEVTFVAVDAQGRKSAARPFEIPAALAPLPPRVVVAPPATAGLTLHVETRAGGSLCPGDYTQLHVNNDSGDPLYVRVINLDASGEALLLFPNDEKVGDLVMPGKSAAISEEGFTIDGVAAGDRERYVVIGSRSPDGLGAFGAMRGVCRFRAGDAARLQKGERLAAAYRSSTGFTILDEVRCKKPIPLPEPALKTQALAELPWCPPLD